MVNYFKFFSLNFIKFSFFYIELAQKFTANDKIYISKIDCTENSDTCIDYQVKIVVYLPRFKL